MPIDHSTTINFKIDYLERWGVSQKAGPAKNNILRNREASLDLDCGDRIIQATAG